MKSLKIILWICGIGCLTTIPLIVFPWNMVEKLYRWFGQEPIPAVPAAMYLFRITNGLVGLIGVFFIMLARNPLRFGPMLSLSSYGLIFFGLLALVSGLTAGMSPVIYLGDGLFGLAFGVVILILSSKAQRTLNE
jgi:hypothetical protein